MTKGYIELGNCFIDRKSLIKKEIKNINDYYVGYDFDKLGDRGSFLLINKKGKKNIEFEHSKRVK